MTLAPAVVLVIGAVTTACATPVTRANPAHPPARTATAGPAAPARAQPAPAPSWSAPTPTGPWRSATDARVELGPWTSCPDLELAGEGVEVRTTDRGIEVRHVMAGSGRWGVFREDHVLIARGACDGPGYTLTGGLESSIVGVQADAAAAPHVAALAQATRVTNVDDPAVAAARMLVTVEQSEPSTTELRAGELGPAWPIQPAHAGTPRGSAATYWDRTAIIAAGFATPQLADDDAERIGLLVRPLRAPTKIATRGGYELWEIRFRSRLGGGLLAVYDRARDQTRWVFGAQIDLRDTPHIRMIASAGSLVLVRAGEGADERVFAIDLERAITRPYGWIDGTRARAQGDAIAIAPPGGPSRLLRASDL
ncbi:MAG TPA: hypothetical protein VFQ53_28715 [Kofleriaceae bacterium]|nr:hypothetical protein [Kofleriaceae bacterium]